MNSSNCSLVLAEPNQEDDQTTKLIEIVQIILLIFIITSNSLVILLFLRMKRKKKQIKFSGYILLSLTVSDLFVGIFAMSFELLYTLWSESWRFGDFLCVALTLNSYSQYTCSFLSLLLLSLHRYMQLWLPFKTTENLSKRKIIIVLATWVIPYFYYGLLILVYICSNLFTFNQCLTNFSPELVLVSSIIFNLAPISGMIILNVLTFIRILINRQKRLVMFKNINANYIIKENLKNTSPNLIHIKQKISKEIKASICIAMIILNLILTQSIYLISSPIVSFCSNCIDNVVYTVGYWMSYSFSTFNPIILIAFHQRYKKEFLILFCRRKI
jgi:hypothetical protein